MRQLVQVQELVQLTANVRLFLPGLNTGHAFGNAKEENDNKKKLMLRDMD